MLGPGAEAAGLGRGEGWWGCLGLGLPLGAGVPLGGLLPLRHAVARGATGGGNAAPGRGSAAQHTV